MTANRDETVAWLGKKGIKALPSSHANMFMVDWGKPAKDMQAAIMAENVQIGRSWPIWPNVSRVTVGSAADMAAFRNAVAKVLKL
jgi:histidinol-phosphate aminotransferase